MEALRPLGDEQIAAVDEVHRAVRTEEVDDVLQKHSGVLEAVLPKFGNGRWLTPAQFQTMLSAASAFDSEFHIQHASFAFRAGMMTHVEECCRTRIHEMTHVELLYALAFVVSRRSGYDPNCMAMNLDTFLGTNLSVAVHQARAAR